MKTRIFLLFILGVMTLLSSCEDDSIKITAPYDTKYTIETKDGFPLIYIKAKNVKGFCDIPFPNENGEITNISIPNEQLQQYVEMFIRTKPEVKNLVKQLNYINLRSNDNLIISYNTEKGEMLIPDMLKEDGSLKRSIKLRKSYDRFFPRITEEFGLFIGLPAMGELPENFSLSHRTDENGVMLVYMDSKTSKNIATIIPNFGLSPEITSIIGEIAKQYGLVDDVIELGIYLKKIN